jgi:hypothetical protein
MSAEREAPIWPHGHFRFAVDSPHVDERLISPVWANVPENKRILYRIGVNLGDVLIENEDILGDGVNIAARLEPGGMCLSGSAFDHVRGKIEADFVDLGNQSLKNIARPVRVYAVKAGLGAPASAPAFAPAGPPRLSIVVLPFANLGGDPEQEYFVDGVTESLTTDLSRISGSFVIGRHTAFTYKSKAVERSWPSRQSMRQARRFLSRMTLTCALLRPKLPWARRFLWLRSMPWLTRF